MNKLAPLMLAVSLAFAGSAVAQDDPTTVTLQSQGEVMVSADGGEFVTAQPGAQLQPGARVMVSEGASVQLMYPNACQMPLTSPGVYTITAVCTPAVATGAAAAAAATDWAALGILAGTVAVGAAGLDSMDETEAAEPPPVSR